MRLSRRTNTIILWIISIGLLVGMVIMFTPTMGGLTGAQNQSATVMTVDGEPVTELDVAQARQSSPVFNMVNEGPVAEDLELLLVDGLIRQEVLRQAAATQRVGNREVRDELAAFRERNGVDGSRNDEAYLRLIGGAGYTDQTFREYLRQQLQVAAWQEEVSGDVEVSDAEVESFYRVNQDAYLTEPRVVARQIVTDDRETAEEARERVEDGEAFADVASDVSVERAEQGGALGGDEPQPVGRPAFPSAVADAVFSLGGSGLTPVVESAGRFYVVSVEELLPAEPRPLDEVRDEVRDDALAAKRQAILDAEIEERVREADVEILAEDELSYEDSVVATVGDEEIRSSELVRATYGNPQIQQALSPDTASLVAEFFKPSILEQLVDRELAVQGAEELDATFFGSDALVAQSALDWVARDAEVTEEEVVSFYESNPERYTVPASAEVRQVEFDGQDEAMAYRDAVLDGQDPVEAAEAAGGAYEDRGTVREGDLEPELDTAVFATDGFEPLPEGDAEVSDVLVIEREVESAEEDAAAEEGAEGEDAAAEEATDEDAAEEDAAADEAPATEEAYVVLLAERTSERVRPLEEVRSDVEQTLLAQKRQELQREWLEGLREEVEVEVLLPSAAETPAAGAAAGDGAEAAEGGASEDAASGDADASDADAPEGEAASQDAATFGEGDAASEGGDAETQD